nr:hypothetical protein [Clavibacter zhangzhiyongii]
MPYAPSEVAMQTPAAASSGPRSSGMVTDQATRAGNAPSDAATAVSSGSSPDAAPRSVPITRGMQK